MAQSATGHHTLVALEKVEAMPTQPSDPLRGILHVEGGTGIAGPFAIVTVS